MNPSLEELEDQNKEPENLLEKQGPKQSLSPSRSNRKKSQRKSSQPTVLDVGNVGSSAPAQVKTPQESRIEKEYREWVGGLLGPASLLLAVIFCSVSKIDHEMQLDYNGNKVVLHDLLAMTSEEVEVASPALAHILAKMNIPSVARKRLINSKDYIDLGMVLFSWGERNMRTVQYIKLMQNGGIQHVTRKQPTEDQRTGQNGHVTEPANISDFGQYQPG